MCNISLVQSACYRASAIVRVQYMPIYRERPGYSKDVIDSTLSQQKRDRSGYSRDAIDSRLSQQKRQVRLQQRRGRLNAESPEERQARLQQRRNRLNAESAEETETQARLQRRRDRLNAESPEDRNLYLYKLSTGASGAEYTFLSPQFTAPLVCEPYYLSKFLCSSPLTCNIIFIVVTF